MDLSNAEKIYQIMQDFHKIGLNTKHTSDLSRSELAMLKMLKLHSTATEGVTNSTLSELLEISKSAVSQMINALEDKTYVERVTTKHDRRLVYIRLTASGEQRLEQQLQALLQRMAEIFDRMGREDTEDLLRLLQKLYLIVSDCSRK